jgi:glucosamine 6-phosphate synthetase-like amidotransferase/phosphosugar isomerase protein
LYDIDMCGIAGYSFGRASRVNRTLAAQALLAGIAERGADAVGYAHRADGPLVLHKQQTGASALLDAVVLPPATRQALIHVRDFTKGHPTIAANNHPIRHGRVTGIHNGIIANDDELFARHGIERDEPDMTVDSEVIFALVDAHGTSPEVLVQLVGAMAAAWIDERDADVLHVARGVGRPLWLADEGRLLSLVDGALAEERRWAPDRSHREERELPAVRAPHEGRFCLERLAALTAPA